MRRTPWVLSVDATSRQFAELEYWRERDRFSPIGETAIERLERRAYRNAHRIVAWSEWTGRGLRHFGVEPERIEVLHPGVPVLEKPPTTTSTRGTTSLRMLFVGNNVGRKGLQVLLEARQMTHSNVVLDVVTADPVPPAAGVRIHSGVAADSDELQRLYSEVDALVVPTLADCVPLVVVEGMAAGIPVVATDVGAIPELLAAGGLVVPPGDPRALADAIDRLASSPELRARLGQQGHRRARERFDLKLQTDRLVQLLKDSATAGPGPGRDRA